MNKNPYDKVVLWLTVPSLYFPLWIFLLFASIFLFPHSPVLRLLDIPGILVAPVLAVSFIASPFALYLSRKSSKTGFIPWSRLVNLINIVFSIFALIVLYLWMHKVSVFLPVPD